MSSKQTHEVGFDPVTLSGPANNDVEVAPLKLKLRKLQLGHSSFHEAFEMLAQVHQTFRHLAVQLEHYTISARQLRNCSERHQRTSFLPHFH